MTNSTNPKFSVIVGTEFLDYKDPARYIESKAMDTKHAANYAAQVVRAKLVHPTNGNPPWMASGHGITVYLHGAPVLEFWTNRTRVYRDMLTPNQYYHLRYIEAAIKQAYEDAQHDSPVS